MQYVTSNKGCKLAMYKGYMYSLKKLLVHVNCGNVSNFGYILASPEPGKSVKEKFKHFLHTFPYIIFNSNIETREKVVAVKCRRSEM